MVIGIQTAVNWELESKFKNQEVQEDSKSEIILKSMKYKFYKVANFMSKTCQLSLPQVRVVLHFSWQKYTLIILGPTTHRPFLQCLAEEYTQPRHAEIKDVLISSMPACISIYKLSDQPHSYIHACFHPSLPQQPCGCIKFIIRTKKEAIVSIKTMQQ